MLVSLRDNILQEEKENLAKELMNVISFLIFKLLIVLSQNFLVFCSVIFVKIIQSRTVILHLGVLRNLLKL